MAVINDPTIAANLQRVGEVATGATGAGHVTNKPIPTSIGHYRVAYRFAIIAAQAAGSRLFEARNTLSQLFIPTRMQVKILSFAASTALIENSLDVYKGVGFNAVDTVNTVTPVAIAKRTTGFTAAPAGIDIRGVTAAGAAAGMTGGTITALANPFAQCPYVAAQAVMAATETLPRFPNVTEIFDDVNGTHPFALEQNEGIVIANRVLLGAAGGAIVYVDLSYAVVTAF